jgi:ferredoxin-type protein NapH
VNIPRDPEVELFDQLRPQAAETFAQANPFTGAQKAALAVCALGFVGLAVALGLPGKLAGWLPMLGVVGAISLGGVGFFWLRLKDTTPGIKNHGVFFQGVSHRGAWAWFLGVLITGFYCVLYWWDEGAGSFPLKGGVALLEPLSQALRGGPADKWFLYGLAYSVAVLVMGFRMAMKYRHSRYHLIRTGSVAFFQLVLAFIVPGLLRKMNQPEFYFTYFWPLKVDYLFPDGFSWLWHSGHLGKFMFGWGLIVSFVGVPVLTWFFGKRWYCSWVCGCGGLAETAGDPFRQLSDNSTRAWRIERWMIHGVLVFIVTVTAALWLHDWTGWGFLGTVAQPLKRTYGFAIGAAFSGVVGVGFYPLLGSRVWCRFGCPQAALLGILQRWFSRFRITTNGGQCISCGNCSTYCEMGIDVRAYAQKGRNIVRASCVGCGVCAAVCPRGVLKLENGEPGDRYEGADAPMVDMLRSLGVLRRDWDEPEA